MTKRQYDISQIWLKKFRAAIKSYDMKEATRFFGKELAKANLEALKSEHEILKEAVEAYED